MSEYEVDGDGFVCLVAPDDYRGYVDEDWALEDLLARFVEQLNAGTLFVAYAGDEAADSPLSVVADAPEAAVRDVNGVVHVGEGGLWLTDYTQLTMAAQFADEGPVASYGQRLPLEPGSYLVTLSELDDDEYTIAIRPHVGDSPVQDRVPWFAG
ncbi:hypothetical protein ACI3KS_02760 [Microbacterium sp. ZW T5_45]|uniref:hypothetical protein n=1 Tax=Microbacterium sp. ZW T5_45 TaxID=3378080 RepID=UPI0038524CA2